MYAIVVTSLNVANKWSLYIIKVDGVCLSVRASRMGTQRDTVSFLGFKLRTSYCYVNGTCATQIFWSIQLALSMLDPLTQTNTNSNEQSVAHSTCVPMNSLACQPYTVPRVSMNPT